MATENIVVRLAMDASDYVRGTARAKGATDDITQAAAKTEGSVKGLASTYGKVAVAAAGAFVASKVVSFAKDSIAAFSDLEESMNAVRVSFGEGAGAILDFGETAAEQVGLSNAQFNQLSVTTGALLSNFIEDEKAAAEETINLTKRAADMASVFNTSVPDALGAVQAALRGETEPIRRFGVLLDDASIRARAVELGLAATTKEVDRQAKGLAALDLVYEQTEKTAGDFSNTQDSLANKQKILGARFEDTKAAIGEALAPAMDGLLDIATALLPVIESLAPAIGSVGSALGSLAGPVSSATGFLGTLIEKARIGGQFMFGIFPDGTEERFELGIDLLGLSADAVDKLVEAVKRAPTEHEAAEQARLDEANAIDATREAINNEIFARARSAANRPQEHEALRTTAEKYADLSDAVDREARSQDKATDAMERWLNRTAEAASPALRLIRANQDLAAAQEGYAEALDRGDVDEVTNALLGLVEAEADAQSATAALAGSTEESFDAFVQLAVDAGIAEQAARDLAEAYGLIPPVVATEVRTNYSASGTPPPVLSGTGRPAIRTFAEGGDFQANQPIMVGEKGPELLIPSMAGSIVPNNQITGGTTNIYLEASGDAYDDVSLALAMHNIVEEIEVGGSHFWKG